MLPGFVGQQTGAAADAAAAGIVAASATAPGHAADQAGAPVDVAAAFDNALSSACGTTPAPTAAGKTGCADKSAASSTPTFPAWILALGLDVTAAEAPNAKGGDAAPAEAKADGDGKSTAAGKTKTDEANVSEDAGSAVKDQEVKGIVVDVSALTLPVIKDAPVPVNVSGNQASATTTDVVENPASAPTTDAVVRERAADSIQQSAKSITNAPLTNVVAQQQDDDTATVSVADIASPALKKNDSRDTDGDAAVKAPTPRASVAASADIRREKTEARSDAAFPPAPANDLERIVDNAVPGTETAGTSRASTPRQAANTPLPRNATPSSGLETAKGTVAPSAAVEAAAEPPLSQPSLPASAAVSNAVAETAQETRRAPVPAADPIEASSGKQMPLVAGAAPSASGGHNESFQHGESESHARSAGPEPPPVSRGLAWSAALTLVSAPDGTLRLGSPLTTSLLNAPALLSEPPAANIDQMVQTMRVMVKEGVSEATVHLHPEHFGEVSIQVRVDGKTVSAIVHTESAGVREWLQGQESTLRGNLSEHGLQLDRLVVQRDGRQDRRQNTPQQQGQPRRRARSNDDQNQTFEVAV